MKFLLLLALIWCVVSQPSHANSSGSLLPSDSALSGDARRPGYSTNVIRENREHWLKSRLKFSGKTSLTSEGLDGAVGVSSDSLIGLNDSAGFDYRDSKPRKDGVDVSASTFRYRFPVGANQLTLETGNTDYHQAVTSGDRRFNASNESRVMEFGARRPLFSRFGLAFEGIAHHIGRNSRAFEEGAMVSETDYELSSLKLKAHGRRDLWGGLHASTDILAVSGREYSATDYRLSDDSGQESEFLKVVMSASLERNIYRWRWRIRGRYQLADESLPASEYLTVAGSGMMAGFNGQSVSVVRGGWLRMGTESPAWQTPFLDGVLSSVNVSVLHGWVPDFDMQADRYGRASAGQVSLQLRGRAFTADVSVGRMIQASTLAMVVPENPDVRFSLSMGI